MIFILVALILVLFNCFCVLVCCWVVVKQNKTINEILFTASRLAGIAQGLGKILPKLRVDNGEPRQ